MKTTSKAGSIGIDIGGSKTLFALFDAALKPIEEIKVKTHGNNEPKFTDMFTRSVNALLKKATKRGLSISAVGIGCAGSIDTENTEVKRAPNIPALESYSFKPVLKKLTGAEVRLYNDVHAALYGELKFGAAAGYKHVVGVFIGTGVGAAIAIDGRLYTGASGHAGNLGHFLVEPFGLLAGPSHHGILDSLVSRTAIAGDAAALAAKHRAPHLVESSGTDVRSIKSRALAEAIREGDKSVEELVRNRAQLLGIVLANVVDFFNPEMIVLGGGLTDAMPRLIRREVKAGIEAHATSDAVSVLRIVTSKLKNHAATIGAAKLALDRA